jgi:hypothetical protein
LIHFEIERHPLSQEIMFTDYRFLELIETAGPLPGKRMLSGRKCTNGYPVTFAMDIYPDEVICLIILGQREAFLLHSDKLKLNLQEAKVDALPLDCYGE